MFKQTKGVIVAKNSVNYNKRVDVVAKRFHHGWGCEAYIYKDDFGASNWIKCDNVVLSNNSIVPNTQSTPSNDISGNFMVVSITDNEVIEHSLSYAKAIDLAQESSTDYPNERFMIVKEFAEVKLIPQIKRI